MKRRKMIEAFNLLKEEEGTQFVVREALWKQLVKLVAPDISNSHRELLLRISDDEQKGFIGEQCSPLCSGTGEEPGVRSLIPGLCHWDSWCVMDREGLLLPSPDDSSPERLSFGSVLYAMGSSSWPFVIRPSSL